MMIIKLIVVTSNKSSRCFLLRRSTSRNLKCCDNEDSGCFMKDCRVILSIRIFEYFRGLIFESNFSNKSQPYSEQTEVFYADLAEAQYLTIVGLTAEKEEKKHKVLYSVVKHSRLRSYEAPIIRLNRK